MTIICYYDFQIYFIDNNTMVYGPNITYDHATSPSIANNDYLYVTGRRTIRIHGTIRFKW